MSRWGAPALCMALVGLILVGASPLAAIQTTSDFVPMTQAPQDTISGGTLVVAAYAFAWVAIVAYVLFLARRARRIEREITDVQAKIAALHR